VREYLTRRPKLTKEKKNTKTKDWTNELISLIQGFLLQQNLDGWVEDA